MQFLTDELNVVLGGFMRVSFVGKLEASVPWAKELRAWGRWRRAVVSVAGAGGLPCVALLPH